MSKQVILDLPDNVYRQVRSIAERSQRDVEELLTEVVIRSVRSFPEDPRRAAMLREVEAFHALHPVLRRDYAGQYVAVHQGRPVDHDLDPIALLERVRRDYPGRTVLRRKVEDEPEVTLHFRSPLL